MTEPTFLNDSILEAVRASCPPPNDDFTSFQIALMRQDPTIRNVFDMGDGTYISIKPLLFTWAIIRGDIGDLETINERWCYPGQVSAVLAALDWLTDRSQPEPGGWIRHPTTGRRRPNGDPNKQEVRY